VKSQPYIFRIELHLLDSSLGRVGLHQNTTEFSILIYYVDDMFRPLWAVLRSQMHKRKTI